jgi:predicted metal-dependent phosphoesterase TrpH
MLIDLHTHSYPRSDDSFMSADELIEAAKRLGLDGVCLTDHDAFWSPDETRALSRRHDFLVLPGVELNTDSGHVLVFGLDRYLFGMHKPAFLRELVDQKGGVMIAAHPYRRRFLEEPGRKAESRGEMLDQASGDEFFGYCDAIEGINGRGSAQENWFSLDLRHRLAMRSTGGSDAHRIGQFGTAATRFQEKITGLTDLIEEIRQGRFCPVDLRNQGDRPAGPTYS